MSNTNATSTSNEFKQPRPWHLWVLGILSLIWNGFGVFDFLATRMQWAPYMANFTEQQLNYYNGLPAWQVVAWILGVWGAVFGSIGLLLAKRWAVWMFALSLIGMLANFMTYFWSDAAREALGSSGWILSAVIVVIAVGLLRYARGMTARGVLR